MLDVEPIARGTVAGRLDRRLAALRAQRASVELDPPGPPLDEEAQGGARRAFDRGRLDAADKVDTVALITRSEDALAPLLQGVGLPLLLLSGILLPMSVAPGWLKTLSSINPLTTRRTPRERCSIGSGAIPRS